MFHQRLGRRFAHVASWYSVLFLLGAAGPFARAQVPDQAQAFAWTADDEQVKCDEPVRNEALVRAFYEVWSRLDVEELMSYFTETSVWHNVPDGEPLRGASAIRQVIEWLVEDWTRDAKVNFEVLNFASRENLVFSERVDHVESLGRRVDLPVVGIFLIENGKIVEWRDYYDAATFNSGLPPRIPWRDIVNGPPAMSVEPTSNDGGIPMRSPAPPNTSLQRTQRGVTSFACANAAPPHWAAELHR